MKKLEGLVYIGFGLFAVGVWIFPIYWIEYTFEFHYPTTVSSAVIATLHDIPDAFLYTLPWNSVAVVGLILISIGIYRLVRSLLRSRHRQ